MKALICIFLVTIIATSVMAATNTVRTVDVKRADVISDKQNWRELAEAANRGFGDGTVNLNRSKVVAWCVKADHLDYPPRLFEEAIVMINGVAPGRTNSWALAYLGRMPAGGVIARSWSLFDHPRPLLNFSTFSAKPSDDEIASFIKATNFGHNDFYSDRLVLDVVLYHSSAVVQTALSDGLPENEKRTRHSAYLKSIPY
jgi:hypothetical protein